MSLESQYRHRPLLSAGELVVLATWLVLLGFLRCYFGGY